MDDTKVNGVDECSEDPGEILHKTPTSGLLRTCDVTPVILTINLVSHPICWALLVPVEKAKMVRFLTDILGEEEVPRKLICLLDLSSKHSWLVIIKPNMMADKCHKLSMGSSDKMLQ